MLDAPHLIITANVLVADTAEEADFQAGPGRLMTRGIRRGHFEPLRSPDDAVDLLAQSEPATPNPLALRTDGARSGRVVGTPDHAVAELDELVDATGADELMVSTVAYDLATRLRSLELLVEGWRTTDVPDGRDETEQHGDHRR